MNAAMLFISECENVRGPAARARHQGVADMCETTPMRVTPARGR